MSCEICLGTGIDENERPCSEGCCRPLPHFNGLSPAEAERLALLAEECGEVIQAIGKILRHGYQSVHPEGKDRGRNNRDNLEREMGDVRCAMIMLCDAKDVSKDRIHWRADDKRERVGKYLHHQNSQADGG